MSVALIPIQMDGHTALTLASKYGHTATVKALVHAGADLLKGPVSTISYLFFNHLSTCRHQPWPPILLSAQPTPTYNNSHYASLFHYIVGAICVFFVVSLPQKGFLYGTYTPLNLASNEVSSDFLDKSRNWV